MNSREQPDYFSPYLVSSARGFLRTIGFHLEQARDKRPRVLPGNNNSANKSESYISNLILPDDLGNEHDMLDKQPV